MSYSVPYTFIPGTKARAQEVNANFASITDSIDELDTSKLDLDLSNITPEGIEFIKNNTITRNIGEIFFTPIPFTDVGVHLLDGTKISGDGIYNGFVKYIKKLYNEDPTANYFTDETSWQNSVTTYGVCGKFVYDSVNNTVRLPKYGNQLCTKTSTITTKSSAPVAGNGMTLGLTDGTNNSGLSNHNDHYLEDFQGLYGKAIATGASGSKILRTNVGLGITTNFSKSGLIANTSNILNVTHYPLDAYYYIVLANSTKTEIQSDIDEIAADLNGKADTDLTNVTDTGYIKMAGAGMPSDTYIDLTLGASGTTYTAPADGWFCVRKNTASTNQYIAMGSSQNQICTKCFSPVSSNEVYVNIPVLKNQTVWITYSASGSTNLFCFIYAQGSESEAQ